MKYCKIFFFLLMTGFLLAACSTSSDSSGKVLRNQTGTLIWGGSPAADGVGIIFEVGDTSYGAPGSRSDYAAYFPGDENEVMIRADIRLTGETTIRGWGTEFPEIKFLRIKRKGLSKPY